MERTKAPGAFFGGLGDLGFCVFIDIVINFVWNEVYHAQHDVYRRFPRYRVRVVHALQIRLKQNYREAV